MFSIVKRTLYWSYIMSLNCFNSFQSSKLALVSIDPQMGSIDTRYGVKYYIWGEKIHGWQFPK